jgi:hypothetical protein
MSTNQPRKRPRLKKLNFTVREQWEAIVKSVKKSDVPVNVLDSIAVHLIDGTRVDISISEMVAQGVSHDDIQDYLNEKLITLDSYIENVDFYVSVDEVARLVQPLTDLLLKDL